jgi:hypothetical protein
MNDDQAFELCAYAFLAVMAAILAITAVRKRWGGDRDAQQ